MIILKWLHSYFACDGLPITIGTTDDILIIKMLGVSSGVIVGELDEQKIISKFKFH